MLTYKSYLPKCTEFSYRFSKIRTCLLQILGSIGSCINSPSADSGGSWGGALPPPPPLLLDHGDGRKLKFHSIRAAGMRSKIHMCQPETVPLIASF